MNLQDISVGASVELNSGGPEMTVDRIAGENVCCSWIYGEDRPEGVHPDAVRGESEFEAAMLKPYVAA